MASTSNPHLWVLGVDGELMDRTLVALLEDYDLSDFHSTDLWDADPQRHPKSGMLRYRLDYADIDSLSEYDFYPAENAVPVISSRMKACVQSVCGADEVEFRACDLFDKSGRTLSAWNMFPLNAEWCIDKEKSRVHWFVPNLKPEFMSVDWASKIVFKPDCLGARNIVRLMEGECWLIVSDKLKCAMEALNPKGIQFTHDSDNWIGNPFRSTEAKYYS
jgi:hypothetical protein